MSYPHLTSTFTKDTLTFEIVVWPVDDPAFYTFDGDRNIEDHTQDNVEQCKLYALEEFGVPMDSWKEQPPLHVWRTTDKLYNGLQFSIYDDSPKIGSFLRVMRDDTFLEVKYNKTTDDCKADALERYAVPIDAWIAE